ncbi:hypothetical protein EDC57_0356 [Inmirania thermothiophila]|uniref:Uncharacterized protein n=1 Tax=Inmirania thermothiophila TaxID=1750597 RepID=A0A3N1Y7H0_9GAMM|nr:hypothetical protein EDC57_0356 [Inmirania thermothiophila]
MNVDSVVIGAAVAVIVTIGIIGFLGWRIASLMRKGPGD